MSSASVGVGFSAAGFYFPYHCGVWEHLVRTGVMRADTPTAGASAGSLVAAMHACGLTPSDGTRILSDVLARCRKEGVVGKVGNILEDALRKELPRDAHVRCSKGNLFVSISSPRVVFGEAERAANGGSAFALDGEIVSEFESFDDLVGALLASCHIPLYCGWPARRYRGKWCVDGGWHNLTPTPTHASEKIRVCAFPLLDAWNKAEPGNGKETGDVFARDASFWAGWGDDDIACRLIAPDAADGVPMLDYKKTIKWALLPASDEILEQLVVMGREDAERWAKRSAFASSIDMKKMDVR